MSNIEEEMDYNDGYYIDDIECINMVIAILKSVRTSLEMAKLKDCRFNLERENTAESINRRLLVCREELLKLSKAVKPENVCKEIDVV